MLLTFIRLGLLLMAGLILCIYLIVGSADQALASIHKYPESSTQVMYRSQQSLRDAKDKAWQVVLFKRLNSDQVDCVHLRLVGFPGLAELAHPRELQITAGTGEVWTADDVVSNLVPANVGEYDFLTVMSQLNSDTPLRLALPLKTGQLGELLIPPFAVREWRLLMQL